MAVSQPPTDPNTSVPDYECVNVNSTVFHIGSFQREWQSRLKPCEYSYQLEDEETFDANFAKELGIGAETMAELKSVCRHDSLRCHPEGEGPNTEVVPEETRLRTLKQRKKRQDHRVLSKKRKNRHDAFAEELECLSLTRKSEAMNGMIPEGEVILTFNIYYPTVSDRLSCIRPHMTLLMTGSHSLDQLRDAITCVSDLQVSGEFSNTPNMPPDFTSKEHYRSAFFFFEGVFYNDMRYPECQDISTTTIEWAKTRNFPPYSQAKMEDTRFADLKVKVGFPYLYCHQGDCEHLVIITDVRLAHGSDCLDKKQYPLLTYKNRIATQKCAVCNIFISRWYTTNDQFAPSDPCHFCDKCFWMLHYDDQDKKLGDFLAYPYVDRGAFN
ncbi:snRNA-activating protein complex subunit 3 [Pholidichthys leucotaenia]